MSFLFLYLFLFSFDYYIQFPDRASIWLFIYTRAEFYQFFVTDGNGLQLQLSGTMLWRCHDFFETILSFFYRRHSTPFAVLRRSSNSFLIHSDLIRHVSSQIFLFVLYLRLYGDSNKYLFVWKTKYINKNWWKGNKIIIAREIWKITIIINE